MYKFNIVNFSKKLTNNDIEEVERLLGMKFPIPLKKHYLSFNGGVVAGGRRHFVKSVASESEINDFTLGEFFPVKYKIRSKQITFEYAYSEFFEKQKIVPKGYLAIADDVSGWPICYRISDGGLFLVYREMLDENGNEKLIKITDSLSDFIDEMIDDDEFEESF